MQKTTFPVRIVIFDDCSTDGARDIIREYEAKYPHLFFVTYAPENTWKKPIRKEIGKSFKEARNKAKYIALCEGDDCWTDPDKLQKQVDFMEQHPDYSLIAGGYISKNAVTGEEVTNVKVIKGETKGSLIGFDITLERQLESWLTKTLTLLYRKDSSEEYFNTKYQYGKDLHLYYHLLKKGKGYYLSEVLGVYSVHEGGIFSLKSQDSKTLTAYNLAKELYQKQGDTYSRKLYGRSIQKILVTQYYKRNTEFKIITLFFSLFLLIRSKKELKSFVSVLYHCFFSRGSDR